MVPDHGAAERVLGRLESFFVGQVRGKEDSKSADFEVVVLVILPARRAFVYGLALVDLPPKQAVLMFRLSESFGYSEPRPARLAAARSDKLLRYYPGQQHPENRA